MKKLYSILFLIIVMGTWSCREYVEIDQVGKRALKYTSDYQNLLNNTTTFEKTFYYPVLASDDIYSDDETYLNSMSSQYASSYIWKDNIVGDAEDMDWSNMYKQLYIYNQIVEDAMVSEGGTDQEKRNVRGQAKLGRALTYFHLVNIYAKQYDVTTAGTDLGVPLLLKPDLYADLTRQPVQVVYDQIIADLRSAIEDLPARATYNVLGSQVAAKAMLGRVYLQMGRYEEALQYAGEVLDIQGDLVDLNSYIASPNTYPNPIFDPEEIYLRTINNASPILALNPDLLALFDTNDLRYELFVVDGSVFSWNAFNGKGYNKYRIAVNGKTTNGPSVPEMMLIKAEALARDPQHYTEAVDILNALREKRFRPEDFTPLTLTAQDEILVAVMAERRKELMAKGLRWFDQKRLKGDSRFVKTQTRTYKGETYTLTPESNRYVFPIASKYIQLNPEIVQNP